MKNSGWKAMECCISILGKQLKKMDSSDPLFDMVEHGYKFAISEIYGKDKVNEMYSIFTDD